LDGHNYSYPGWYFVTICTYDHKLLFGEIVNSEMILNEYGLIAKKEWIESESIRKEIELNDFVIMPNHFHALIGY
jgi:putative transposase